MQKPFSRLVGAADIGGAVYCHVPGASGGWRPATVFHRPPADAVPVGSSLTLAEALRLALAHNP